MNILENILVLGLVVVFCSLEKALAEPESLYSEASYEALYSDKRSFSVGQSLTVLIFERTSAETTAGTDTNRSNDVSAGVSIIDKDKEGGNLGFSNRFEGGGSSSRTGKLVASVTVNIVGTTDKGELLIKGRQVINLNNEKQHLFVSGRVRQDDVTVENTVLSSRIADALIEYKGDGLLGKRQGPGVITKVFNWIF